MLKLLLNEIMTAAAYFVDQFSANCEIVIDFSEFHVRRRLHIKTGINTENMLFIINIVKHTFD